MDGTANFGGINIDDAAIDPPAAIGSDERRMHVRAYNYWVSLLDGRAYPSIEDLNPEAIDDFGPNSVLLDFTSGVEDPSISFLGHRLREACELPPSVESVEQIPPRSLLSRLTDHYMQIIANRAPIGFEAEFINEAGCEIMYRGILMPFSSDDDTIDFIYGVINWKEAADAALASQIQAEIARIEPPVSAMPERLQVPVPVFADGPGGGAAPEPVVVHDDMAEVTAFDSDPEMLLDVGLSQPSSDDALADWLAAARYLADEAQQANLRGRQALYRALGMAYDFALAARARPDEYQELLEASGLVEQPRAPMTPLVKLVFGAGYDKTRLAEYAMALHHGLRSNVSQGDFHAFVDAFSGGLKGVVQAERSLKRNKVAGADRDARYLERARSVLPRGIIEAEGEEEFVLLVARRVDAGHVAVLGQASADDRLIEKALRELFK